MPIPCGHRGNALKDELGCATTRFALRDIRTLTFGVSPLQQLACAILEHVTVGGNSSYTNIADLAPLVRGAIEVASSQNFDHSCAPEQGRLLSVLAGGFDGQRVGETGTGCGVGLAWMVEVTNASTSFVSIELDETRASLSAHLFADHPNVRVLNGNWSDLREYGPFDLLVLDGGGKGKEPADDPPLDPTDGWLALGGTIVLDDFTPAGQAGASAHDEARRYWLEHPVLHATELRLSPKLATVVGSRFR
jgi:predicted O-methyltransferase YrrM